MSAVLHPWQIGEFREGSDGIPSSVVSIRSSGRTDSWTRADGATSHPSRRRRRISRRPSHGSLRAREAGRRWSCPKSSVVT